MKRSFFLALAMWSLLPLCSAQAQDPFAGYWAGGSNLFGSSVFIQARFEKTPAGYKGYFCACSSPKLYSSAFSIT